MIKEGSIMMTSKNDGWLNFDEIYLCPYCGTSQKLRDYEIKQNKDGKIRSITCTICNEKMRKDTLTCKITPFEWGEWLYLSIRTYNSHFYKFHDKVHMDSIAENLKLGSPQLANDFWDGWFNAKDEWSKGTGNKLLLEIEAKMYPKKRISKLNGFFGGKPINRTSDKSPTDTFDDLKQKGQDPKNKEVAQKGSIENHGGGSRDYHTYFAPRKCSDNTTIQEGE
jgi:hypothetical protein